MAVRPENLPLICGLLSFFVLSLTNRADVRQHLSFRLNASPFALFVAALPGRSAMLMLCIIAGFSFGLQQVTGSIGSIMGLACIGAALGYLMNLPFLLCAVYGAWAAVRCLRADAHAALEAGVIQACEELDSSSTEKRVWGACFKEADEDLEIAANYYMHRRARAVAKDRLLAGGKWSTWISCEALSHSMRDLLGGWEDGVFHAPRHTTSKKSSRDANLVPTR